MAEYKLKVDRLSDKEVWGFFLEAAELLTISKATYTIAGASGGTTVDLDDEASTRHLPFGENTYLLFSVSVSEHQFTIQLSRGVTDDTPYGFDQLRIVNSQRDYNSGATPLPDEKLIKLSRLVSEKFIPAVPSAGGLYRDPATFKAIMQSHQRMLERMQKTITSVGEEAASVRTRLEEEYWQKSSALLKENEKRRREFESEVDRLKTRLAEEEQQLEERRKSLDDRDNTHARRALHSTLKQRLAEHAAKFELTDDTTGRRKPIHLAIWVAAASLVALIIFNSWALQGAFSGTTSTTSSIIMLLKPVGLTVALLGLVSWYLRWMNRWFERHADAEFQLKQFELDIDRASWVVETALEWRFSQNSAIPQHLLDNISRNLFSKGEKDESADMHPADYLASALIGKASSVRLSVPGGEVELGPKALNGAGKS